MSNRQVAGTVSSGSGGLLPGMLAGGNQAVSRWLDRDGAEAAGTSQVPAGPASYLGGVPVLFGIDQATRQIYVSATVPGRAVDEISAYLYGTPDRAADIRAANGVDAFVAPGATLRLPAGDLTPAAQQAVNQALSDGTILRTDGVPPGESIGPLLVYRFAAAGRSFELTEGQLRGMTQGQATWVLRHARRIHDTAEGSREIHEQHLKDTNAAVRWVADWMADQDELAPGVWDDAMTRSAAVVTAMEGFDATGGLVTDAVDVLAAEAGRLAEAAQALDDAEAAWHRYIEGTISGGEGAVHYLEMTRNISFLTVAGLAASVAAPVVFSAAGTGLATVGVTGTASTVLSGTAAVAAGAGVGSATNVGLNVVAPSAADQRPTGERLAAAAQTGALSGAFGAGGALLTPAVNGVVSQRLFGAAPEALTSFASRATVNVVGGAVLNVPLGVAGSAIGNAADLINGRIDSDEYLSRIGWGQLRGQIIGAILGVLATPLRVPAGGGGALAPRSEPAVEPDVVTQPPQVDPGSGMVTQMAFHRPSGQYLQARYDPVTGTGEIVNLSTGEQVAVVADGTVSPVATARLGPGTPAEPMSTPAEPMSTPAEPMSTPAEPMSGEPAPAAPASPGHARMATALEESGLAADPMFTGLDAQSAGKVATALGNWPRAVTPSLRTRMTTWAREGCDGNPREFANRLEFARARYRELYEENLRALAGDVPPQQLTVAARQATVRAMDSDAGSADLAATLRADLEVIAASARDGMLPADVTPDRVPDAVRDLPALPWETPTAEAYHARKHLTELMPEEQARGGPVEAFAGSLRETVRSGTIVADRAAGSSRQLIFHRAAGPDLTLEAIVYVRADGSAVVATYGRAKAR